MKIEAKTGLQKVLENCRESFLYVGLFSLFINLLMLVPAFYMLQLYDRVVTTGSESTLVALTVLMLFLLGTMGGLEWVRSRILVRVGTRIDALLSNRLYDISFKRALYTGGAQANTQALQDLNGLRSFLTGTGLFAFFDAPWLPLYLLVMFLFHPLIGFFGLVAALVLAAVAVANEKFTSPLLAQATGENIAASVTTATNLRNAEVIESMGMLGRIRGRWEQKNRNVQYWQAQASDRAGFFVSVSKTFRLIVQSLILAVGAYLVIEREITPGVMIAGSILLGRALSPIDQMIGAWKGFVNARSQYQRLNQLLEKMPESPQRMSLPRPLGMVQAEGAVIVPPGARVAVVKGVSFRIQPGDVVGVIGPSAAGKSSLVRGILGIWPTAGGAIRIDGAEAASYDREELGPHVGYLPQDIELFDGNIGENIARFGEVDAEQVVQAARDAGVHEVILRLPEGYDTVIGQSGGALSAGQRQRVGLARALYGNPALIVLDEPNSNLDEQGEQALRAAVANCRQQGRTVVLVTHSMSLLSCVDKLMLMNEGQLQAFGPRDKVLEQIRALKSPPQQGAQKLAVAGASAEQPTQINKS